mmetsp:Transcript_121687/g.211222  ORF Transcript_121687/g.211222 Transcript_121687/m.211222 type:complete len:291 (+) Transcript_121687:276-1148(+)
MVVALLRVGRRETPRDFRQRRAIGHLHKEHGDIWNLLPGCADKAPHGHRRGVVPIGGHAFAHEPTVGATSHHQYWDPGTGLGHGVQEHTEVRSPCCDAAICHCIPPKNDLLRCLWKNSSWVIGTSCRRDDRRVLTLGGLLQSLLGDLALRCFLGLLGCLENSARDDIVMLVHVVPDSESVPHGGRCAIDSTFVSVADELVGCDEHGVPHERIVVCDHGFYVLIHEELGLVEHRVLWPHHHLCVLGHLRWHDKRLRHLCNESLVGLGHHTAANYCSKYWCLEPKWLRVNGI